VSKKARSARGILLGKFFFFHSKVPAIRQKNRLEHEWSHLETATTTK
jgi:hypothetical protein